MILWRKDLSTILQLREGEPHISAKYLAGELASKTSQIDQLASSLLFARQLLTVKFEHFQGLEIRG